MSDWHELGDVETLEREGRLIAAVGGREVGVVRDPETGALYGIRNRCPHHGGPLCLGQVREREGGKPGMYARSGRRVLRCPWHGWEFDLETGRCLDDDSLRAAVYPAQAADGRVRLKA